MKYILRSLVITRCMTGQISHFSSNTGISIRSNRIHTFSPLLAEWLLCIHVSYFSFLLVLNVLCLPFFKASDKVIRLTLI